MENVFVEENGVYSIDCTKALWATDSIHRTYQNAGLHLNDVDFVIEEQQDLFLVEYKNANISAAANPQAFRPESDSKVNTVIRKFFDSLHYLALLNKNKPKSFIYVLEYPGGDSVTRRRLRNRLKTELPFLLQEMMGSGVHMIERLDVLSIDEWNAHKVYGKYPFAPVMGEE